MFTTTLRENDGTYYLSVPEDVVKDLHLKDGSPLQIIVEEQNLVVKPYLRRKYTAEELLAQCDFSLPISEEDREWLDSPPAGRETI